VDTHIAPVTFHVAAVPGQMLVHISDEDYLQIIRRLHIEE